MTNGIPSRTYSDPEIAMIGSFKSNAAENTGMTEQPTNAARVLVLHDVPRKSQHPFNYNHMSNKYGLVLCCRFFAMICIIGGSIAVGILIGKSMSNNAACLVAVTETEALQDLAPDSPVEELEPTADPSSVFPTATDAFYDPTLAPTVGPTTLLAAVEYNPALTEPAGSAPATTSDNEDLCLDYSDDYSINDPNTATDLGHYDGSSYCRFDFFTCEPSSWVEFNSYAGYTTQWLKATASENSHCQADVEHKIVLKVPPGADYDLHVYKFSSIDTRELYQSSANKADIDEMVVVASNDSEDVMVNDCFDYLVMVEYKSGSHCQPWKLEVSGHDCYYT